MHVHMYVHIECAYVDVFTDAPIFVDLLSYLVIGQDYKIGQD